MKKLIVLLIVAAIGWQVYGSYRQRFPQFHLFSDQALERPSQQAASGLNAPVAPASHRCDGRIYCSQMTSCEEATWFLRNCPDTKMDGNNDGIPCERQWCK